MLSLETETFCFMRGVDHGWNEICLISLVKRNFLLFQRIKDGSLWGKTFWKGLKALMYLSFFI